ncbi:MAG: hypothetical protein D6705_18910 [Deltaproteobacteria bacterium]|nr:MAG: hypothetical protein D6705_18910 [Deltaproteobacteria bacterium]
MDPLPTCAEPCSPDLVEIPGRPKCDMDGEWNCTVTSTATEEFGTPELVTELPMGAGHTMRCTPYVLHTTAEAGSRCGGGYQSWMCSRGLVCVAASLVPYCKSPDAAEGCCAVYCDLAAPECPDGSVCRPLLEARPEYADYANLGVCASP